MKCPEEGCGEDYFLNMGTQHQLLGFMDNIRPHHHDPNLWCSIFECKNGHKFEVAYRIKCPVSGCDFNK